MENFVTNPKTTSSLCVRTFTAFGESKSVADESANFNKSDLEYALANWWNNTNTNRDTDEQYKREFGNFCLEKFVALALCPYINSIEIASLESESFYLEKSNETIKFKQLTIHGLNPLRWSTWNTLCEIPLSEFHQAIDSQIDPTFPLPANDNLVALIKNNNLTDLVLNACERDGNYYPSNAKLPYWERRHNEEVSKWSEFVPPIAVSYQTDIISEDHRILLEKGELPATDAQKSQLFWELFMFRDKNSDLCRDYVLKEIKHLDLTLVNCNATSNQELVVMSEAFDFVARHFKGDQITFSGLSIPPGFASSNKCSWSLQLMMGNNPNLRMINVLNSPSGIEHLIKGLNEYSTLVALNIDGSSITTASINLLGKHLRSNSNLRSLSLQNTGATFNLVKFLVRSRLTSLNVKGNPECQSEEAQNQLCDLLLKNPTITSFEIDWLNPANKKRCDEHLIKNLFNKDYDSYRNHAQLQQTKTDLLPNDVFRHILGWLYIVNQSSQG